MVFLCGKAMMYYVTLKQGKQQDGQLNTLCFEEIFDPHRINKH